MSFRSLILLLCVCSSHGEGVDGDCSSQGVCTAASSSDEGADFNELMQRQVKVATMAGAPPVDFNELIHRNVPGSRAFKKSIEALLTESKELAQARVTHGKASIDPSMQEKFQEVQTLVTALFPIVNATRNDAKDDLDLLHADVGKCNINADDKLTGFQSTSGLVVNGAHTAHGKCRSEEADSATAKTTVCAALESFINREFSEKPLKTKPETKDPEEWNKYLEDMDEHFGCPKTGESKYAEFAEKNANCVSGTTSARNIKDQCDKNQSAFELVFCSYRMQFIDACGNLDTCYEDAESKYITRKKEIDDLIPAWKEEYTGLKQIMCYLDIWMSDDDVSTVDQTVNCDHLNDVNTVASHMDMDFDPVAKKTNCTNSPQYKEYEKYEEYKSLLTDSASCQGEFATPAAPPAAPTTAAPTTAAPVFLRKWKLCNYVFCLELEDSNLTATSSEYEGKLYGYHGGYKQGKCMKVEGANEAFEENEEGDCSTFIWKKMGDSYSTDSNSMVNFHLKEANDSFPNGGKFENQCVQVGGNDVPMMQSCIDFKGQKFELHGL